MTRHIGVIMASLAALALFAACNSSQSYTPATGGIETQQTQRGDFAAPSFGDGSVPLLQQAPDVKSYCHAQKVKLPAQITILASAGEIAGGKFASSSNRKDSLWVKVDVDKSTVPTPTPAPSSNPPRPFYVYYGTFTLKNGNTGCALLLTTQDGKPIVSTSPFNAALAAAPSILEDISLKAVAEGFAKVKTGKLTRDGGSGSIVLVGESSPGVYTTGTLKFNGRAAFK
jgi:hypothetical protein